MDHYGSSLQVVASLQEKWTLCKSRMIRQTLSPHCPPHPHSKTSYALTNLLSYSVCKYNHLNGDDWKWCIYSHNCTLHVCVYMKIFVWLNNEQRILTYSRFTWHASPQGTRDILRSFDFAFISSFLNKSSKYKSNGIKSREDTFPFHYINSIISNPGLGVAVYGINVESQFWATE